MTDPDLLKDGGTGRPRTVVIGGGFAGMATVRALANTETDVLLLDHNLHNTFQPLLYQVATGGLNPGDITYSLRAFAGRYDNVRFQRAEVTDIDADQRLVHLDSGEVVRYDDLVIATGVVPNYLGIPGAEEHSSHIYTRNEAIALRDRMMGALEAVAQSDPEAVEPVMVVVGGGAVGVEIAGALADLRNTAIPIAYPELDPRRLRIILVELLDHLLDPYAPRLQRYTRHELRRRGVQVRTGISVEEVREDGVTLSDGQDVPAVATIWATGVTAPQAIADWGLPQGPGGRIDVDDHLRVRGHDHIYAVGDIATIGDDPLPQLAQPALQGGKHVAEQILRRHHGMDGERFTYRDKGIMTTIGRTAAAVQFPSGLQLRGLVAWVTWVTLHIATLMSNRNRLATMANLAVRYIGWSRSANIIVGDPDPRPAARST